MVKRLMNNRYGVLLVVLCLAMPSRAQYGLHTRAGVEHGLNISLGGGMAMTHSYWQQDGLMKDKMGAEAGIQLTYELRKEWFIFGVGSGIEYDYTRQGADSLTDLFERIDREGDDITYAYRYTDYEDGQQRMLVSVPVYVGACIGPYFYMLLGVKATFPVEMYHKTKTTLETDGTYHRFIHTIKNAPTYGYYSPDTYTSKSRYDDAQWYIAPTIELGSNFTLNDKVAMRVGVYAAYNFPFKGTQKLSQIDYSAVDINPMTQNKANLQENIVFNSVTASQSIRKASEYWSVGIRWTCRFIFPKRPVPCRCLEI